MRFNEKQIAMQMRNILMRSYENACLYREIFIFGQLTRRFITKGNMPAPLKYSLPAGPA